MLLFKKIRGSDSYWRAKKGELNSWINYHVEQGHGGPSAFMTFSCAKYYWPDLMHLLQEREKIAENAELIEGMYNLIYLKFVFLNHILIILILLWYQFFIYFVNNFR